MIRINKVYSDNDLFREIQFKDGLNLILGDNSVNNDGKTVDKHQNGVGKSLAVELIDFCLAIRSDQSRIMMINDKYLPKEAYVNLEFTCDTGTYTVSRNKKGSFRLKKDDEEYKDYGYEEIKKHLHIIIGLGNSPISVRDYFNFFIKREDYDYSAFNELYRSTYVDLMRIQFYLFNINLDLLSRIKEAFECYDVAIKNRREVNKWLEDNGLKIDQLRAKRNSIEQKVTTLEEDFNYDNILASIEDKKDELTQLESEINDLINKRSLLQVDLSEINDYINEFEEPVEISNTDIEVVFSKYKAGLGELIEKDLEELYQFRDQLAEFKSELTSTRRGNLKTQIGNITDQIKARQEKIQRYYSSINEDDKNHIVKSFRSYKDDVYEFRQYDQYIDRYDEASEKLNNAQATYSNAANELSKIVSQLREAKDSFEKTFVELHERITGSSEASFNFSVNVNSGAQNKKDFFKFSAVTETTGSMGSNHLRAALYDMALHINTYTKPHTLGLIVHDNLIFGLLDKASSIKYLNTMNNVVGETVQYIAAINSDDFKYQELLSEFDFKIEDHIAIQLTKDNPLFHGIYRDFMSN